MSLTSKQENYKNYLTTHNYTVEFSENTITFCCENNPEHINNLTLSSFANSKAKFKIPKDLCKFCRSEEENNKNIIDLQSKTKHKILKYVNRHDIEYQCFICNSIRKSNKQSLLSSSNCIKCLNIKNRKDYDTLKSEVEKEGFSLITTSDDYTNNKNICVVCKCGNEWNCSLNDLKRGRNCVNCKTEKTYSTNNILYGVDNVFQNEDVKKKSKETCIKNHGVEFAQQSETVREKTTKTSMEKYGYKRAFCKPGVYKKIKATCLEKYGCEFPLQSKFIREKINNTFISLCGQKRPFGTEYYANIILEKYGNTIFVCTEHFKNVMLEKYGSEFYVNSEECKKQMMEKYGSEFFINSEECKKQMMEKYGSEFFINSEHSKKQMLEKYGSEFFINSEECKKQMMEKYGVEHALQNDKLFSKMLASSFRRRIYKYGDGRSVMILGYEDLAIKELEDSNLYSKIEAGDSKEIPTFWYEFEGKKHKYYPDIYVSNNVEKIIIEVKSTYYFEKDKQKNLAKAIEVSKTYKFFFYVYFDRKKSKTVYSLSENNDLIVIEEVHL
jgi:hypothetical protein